MFWQGVSSHENRKALGEAGISLVEIAIAMALLGLVVAAGIATLISLNKNAAGTRIMSSAREIVQRNMEVAVGVPFNAATEPNILKETTTTGPVNWDDSGGTDPVNIYTSRDGSSAITGTLTRQVDKEANPVSADLRRVTFKLSYKMYGRNLTYQMSTIRAMDR